jgi:hypothetical protein
MNHPTMTDRTSTTLTGKEMKKRAGAMKGINETDPNDMAFKGAMIFGGVGAMMMMPTMNDAATSASIVFFATAWSTTPPSTMPPPTTTIRGGGGCRRGVGAMMMMPTTNDASASIASFATAVNSGDNDDDLRGGDADITDCSSGGAMIFDGVGAMMMMPTANDAAASASIAFFATDAPIGRRRLTGASILPHRAAAGGRGGRIRNRLRGADPRDDVVRGGVHGSQILSADAARTERAEGERVFHLDRARSKARLINALMVLGGMHKINAVSLAETLEGYPDLFVSALLGGGICSEEEEECGGRNGKSEKEDGDSHYQYSSLGRGEDAVAGEGVRWYGGVDVDIIGGGWVRVQSGQHHCLNWDRSDVFFEQTRLFPNV